MIALIGLIVVVGSVIGGFTVAGGQLAALFHVSEIIVICGTALGTLLISTPPSTLAGLAGRVGKIIQPSPFGRGLYLDALKMMFELFQIARRDGLVAIESHIEGPDKSAVFRKYARVLKHHHAIEFLCDSLRLVLVGSVPPHDLEMLLDSEIDVHHEQEARPVSALQRMSDGLPGIGIVAAVLGIVVTMGAIAGPIEQIGEHVAAALTGTFLGVLLAYGFIGPLSNGLDNLNQAEARFYQFMKASVVAFAKGFPPIVAVEFARRTIYAEDRPSFTEMETACKSLKAKAGAE
ncbi:MAG TPA: flagellar motor stator protein MotA [Candidatus Sulfotelmatobacter sp.]|nr:flagellar motor stator protein MotA [Candidatus Sulfotelmatobacter sp.]